MFLALCGLALCLWMAACLQWPTGVRVETWGGGGGWHHEQTP